MFDWTRYQPKFNNIQESLNFWHFPVPVAFCKGSRHPHVQRRCGLFSVPILWPLEGEARWFQPGQFFENRSQIGNLPQIGGENENMKKSWTPKQVMFLATFSNGWVFFPSSAISASGSANDPMKEMMETSPVFPLNHTCMFEMYVVSFRKCVNNWIYPPPSE